MTAVVSKLASLLEQTRNSLECNTSVARGSTAVFLVASTLPRFRLNKFSSAAVLWNIFGSEPREISGAIVVAVLCVWPLHLFEKRSELDAT